MGSTSQQSRWYAMLVKPEHVDDALELIMNASRNDGGVQECFVPMCDITDGHSGSRSFGHHMLAPVCLVRFNGSPNGLLDDMKKTSALRRFAGRKAEFIPLSPEASAWIDENTTPDDRVFKMSEGHMDNGNVTITSGPLMGHESWISKVSHRKKRALVHMDMFGPAVDAEMGLKIVGKKQS